MKTLIAYFSLSGNTQWMAEAIKKRLPNATLHPIELQKEPLRARWLQIMIYGFKTTFYRSMPTKDSSLNMEDYDLIILGAPVWMGNVPPPLKDFLDKNDLKGKKVAAFCSMGGEPSKFFNRLQDFIGMDSLEATLSLVNPLKNQTENNTAAIDAFIDQLKQQINLEATTEVKS